ncbi:hypothetical protein BOX15_Mlig012279g2 [Macrostomum lignano]|uniref:EF-hand domain-containing protein n=1 Tax=Macrostomum lignano TaxID=282301 RepID=A0A267DWI8_9PLAT|nr:hypothetical protein BOX15_Mlig012279g2 [Macrostomum lignano]
MSAHRSAAAAAPNELDAETVGFLMEASRLSAEELRSLYAQFKASQPGGRTSDFMNYVSKSQSSSAQLRKKAHQFFDLFDRNKDRSISRDEVLSIMHSVFLTARDRGVQLNRQPEDVCDEFFSKLDVDGNSEISEEEFVQGVLSEPDLLKILQNPEVMNTLSS